MTDLVNSATFVSSLDASNFQQGADQMVAASDKATAAVTRMGAANDQAGRNIILSENGLHRLAEGLDPTYRQYNRFAAKVEELNAFQAAGFAGTDLEIAQRELQRRAVQSLSGGLAVFEKDQIDAANAVGLFARGLGEGTRQGESALLSWTNIDLLLERMAVRLTALAGLGIIVEFAKSTYEMTAGLEDQAKVLNMDIEAMQAYIQSAKLSGVAAETATQALIRANASLGQALQMPGAQRTALADLGLSPKDLAGGPSAAIPQIASALLAMTDGARRARDEMVLFGRSGQEITPTLEEWAQGTDRLTQRMKELGLIVDDETARKAKEADDKISEAFAHMQATAAPAIVAVANAVSHLLDNMNALANQDWGSLLGFVFNTFFGLGPLLSIIDLFGKQGPGAMPAPKPHFLDANKLAGPFGSAQQQSFASFGIATSGPGTSQNWDQGAWDKYLQGRQEEAHLVGLAATEQAAEREAIAASAEKQRLNGVAADQINRSYAFAKEYLNGQELSLARSNGLLTAQDKLAKSVKETFDGYLASLQQEVHVAGLSTAEREKESAVIKAAQAAQKEHNVAARDLVKTYDAAVAAMERYGHSVKSVTDQIDQKIAGGIFSQQSAAMAEGIVSLSAYREQRSLALEIARQELQLDRQLTDQERARAASVQAINDANTYQGIVEKLQDQNQLAWMYGDHLAREQQILEAISATHGDMSNADADRLRSLIDQNKELRDQAQIMSGIQGSLKSFLDGALHGKLDWKGLARGILDPITSKISGDASTWIMGGLFPQKNVAANGPGILSASGANGLLGSLFGKTPTGTQADPIYVTMSPLGIGGINPVGITPMLGNGSDSGGLLGLLSGGGGIGGFLGRLTGPSGPLGWLGGLASLFSGFFADGGTIPAGQWGIAGENGPEPVFGGSTGATVVPYGAPSYSSASNDNRSSSFAPVINIDARGAAPGMEEKIGQIIDQRLAPALHEVYRRSVHDSVQAVSARQMATGRRGL